MQIIFVMQVSAASEAPRWEEESFVGNTCYTITEQDGVEVIKGEADGTASLLYRRQQIDLQKTPVVSWRWKINDIYHHGISEKSREGDDYPARIYVVVRKGWLPWQTLAINYVWSSSGVKGDNWPSPYTEQSRMVAVDAGNARAGSWVELRRDLVKDFKQYFGEDVTELDGYAVMVDGDNTGSSGTAWFSAIRFHPREEG
ncbi:DUF3047 domain-containing protein [Motiliproteus coralliicola]|uniref:DUF3047 domain-containing protein n=1 Tax=Motiliproteus coralliicola TaxID=2283196 RepID=UPI001403B005|nr:DUF3047 domain-containing protein [Motiliproteus coralliicola]